MLTTFAHFLASMAKASLFLFCHHNQISLCLPFCVYHQNWLGIVKAKTIKQWKMSLFPLTWRSVKKYETRRLEINAILHCLGPRWGARTFTSFLSIGRPVLPSFPVNTFRSVPVLTPYLRLFLLPRMPFCTSFYNPNPNTQSPAKIFCMKIFS